MTIEVSGDPYITVRYSERSLEPQVIICEGRVNVRGRDIVAMVDCASILLDGVAYDSATFTSHVVSGREDWYASFGSVLDPDYHVGKYTTEEIPDTVRNAVKIFTDHFEK